MNLDSLRSAAVLSIDKPHGTRLKYMGGCKCMLCRAANSRYETERKLTPARMATGNAPSTPAWPGATS